MAVTQNSYIGNGSTTTYAFTFPYLKSADIKAQIDATDTTAFTLPTATTLQFNTAPANGAKIKIYRATDDDSLTATFYAGSSIKSEDLNDNFTQNLYTTQEVNARYLSNLGGTMVGDLTLGEDAVITFEGATDDAYETTLTVADPTADRTLTLPDATGTLIVSGSTGTVTGTTIANTTITATNIANATITGTQIANDTITATQIAANAVGASELANDAVDTAAIATGAVTSAKIADGTIVTGDIADDAVTAAKIADNAVGAAAITADAVGASELADNSVASANIINGSILNEDINDSAGIVGTKLANNTITATQIAANTITSAELAANAASTTVIIDDAITSAKIADDSIDSNHYVDGSIDTVHLSNTSVTSDKLGTQAVTTTKIQNASVTRAKIAADAVNEGLIADDAIQTEHILNNAVTTAKIADAELSTLADMQAGTASILAGNTALAATLTEINTICDGKGVQTTISDSDAHYPTSGAVVDYVAAQIAPIGGLEVIADEDNFPTTQPASGVVISISNCDGIVINGSGVCSTARTAGNGSDNVTINGFPASLQSKTLSGELGLMVSSTGSSNTYNYHKLLAKEADVEQLSQDINDFTNRYRVGSSNPTSSLDAGDLFFNTSTNKMLVYNATDSSWDEVQSIGNFYINTISSYSGTGGNSATFNGTAYRFVLSNAPTNAQQLIVSINGVVQKPNAGTSQPGEGFAIDGSSILFSAAPATGSDYFIVTCGSTVNIGTPSDNTVTTAILQNSAVTTAKIADNAITADKIADNLDIPDNNKIRFGTGNDLEIYHASNVDKIESSGNGMHIRQIADGDIHIHAGANDGASNNRIVARSAGAAELYHSGTKKFETQSAGVEITGKLTFANDGLANGSIDLGADADLNLYHDNSDAYFDNNVGNFHIRNDGSSTNEEILIQPKGGEHGIKAVANGQIELYHDNVKKFETVSDGVKITAAEGGEAILYIHADEADDNADQYRIRVPNNDGFHIEAGSGNETALKLDVNAGVQLYYDNVKKFETVSGGAKVTGTLETTDTISTVGNLDMADSTSTGNNRIRLGTDDDLEIYHDGNHSWMTNATGTLVVEADALDIRAVNNEHYLEAAVDGAVKLYHNNVDVFRTHAAGIAVGEVGETQRIFFSDSNNEDEGMISYTHSSDELALVAWGAERLIVKSNDKVQTNLDFKPGTDDSLDIGASGSRFDDVYATNGTIQTSDRNLKDDITATDLGLSFINKLSPVSYKRKGKTRTHYGLVAQDIETVITDLGKNTTQFAPLIKEDISEKQDGSDIRYGLRYDELISPLVKAIQELSAKVAALEAA